MIKLCDKFHVKLDQTFENAFACCNFYEEQIKSAMIDKITTKSTDPDSILGTYVRINPSLELPDLYTNTDCLESDRCIITKFRTGSHSLKIYSGRKDKTGRNQRMCACNQGVQTIEHVLYNCPLTNNIRGLFHDNHNDIKSFFEDNHYRTTAVILKSISTIFEL